MATPESKVDPVAFKASVACLFTTAIVLALGRFFIRAKTYHRFLLDDAILLFACLTLIASICLTYVNLANDIYVHNYLWQVIDDEKLQAINTVFFWATIFAVKFSFLAFFKGLISQVDHLERWWWLVLVVTIPSAAICMCVNFIACPYIGIGIVNCADNEHLDKELALLKATTILDIVTDILIISIPSILLWRVKMSMRRKFALGAVLCLSIFMIIVSLVKVASVYTLGTHLIDLPWVQFWGEIEACVAVIMVSLSAFRSLFVANDRQRKERRQQRRDDERRLAGSSSGAMKQTPSGGGSAPRLPTNILGSALRTFRWGTVGSSNDRSQATTTTTTEKSQGTTITETMLAEQNHPDMQFYDPTKHQNIV